MGVVNGKINSAIVGMEAEITCNDPLFKYQGYSLICGEKTTQVCEDHGNNDTSVCATLPGFKQVGTFDAVHYVPNGTDLEAEAKVLQTNMSVAIGNDKGVVCSPFPASSYLAWDLLNASEKEAAKCLDQTKATWDAGTETKTDNTAWVNLTEAKQLCAITLGWTQATWDWVPPAADGTPETTGISAKFALYAIQQSFSPMGVSLFVCVCLVIGVSIRAVTRHNRRQRSVQVVGETDDLLEDGADNALE